MSGPTQLFNPSTSAHSFPSHPPPSPSRTSSAHTLPEGRMRTSAPPGVWFGNDRKPSVGVGWVRGA